MLWYVSKKKIKCLLPDISHVFSNFCQQVYLILKFNLTNFILLTTLPTKLTNQNKI